MSGLFIKKDYFKQLENLVSKGKFEAALNFAIKEGDALYDKGEIARASELYERLLELFKSANVTDYEIFEKLYEKIIPLLFEDERTEDAIAYSLDLIDIKLLLNKTDEAYEILNALKEEFKTNEKVFLKDIDLALRNGDAESALKTIDYMVSNISLKPELLELAVEILFKRGEKEKALDYLNTLAAVDPQNSFAKTKLAELSNTEGVSAESERSELNENTVKEPQPSHKDATPNSKQSFIPKEAIGKNNEIQDESSSENKIGNQNEELPKAGHIDNSGELNNKKPLLYEITNSEAYKNAMLKIVDSPINSSEDLMNIAAEYENKGSFKNAEYLYLKALLANPSNKNAIDRLYNIYQREKRKEEAIFLLRIGANNFTGREKLGYLLKMSELLPENAKVGVEIVKNACHNNDKDLSLKYFYNVKDKVDPQTLDELLKLMFPVVNNDFQALRNLSVTIRKKRLETKTAFKYFRATGKLLFNTDDKPEGLKWLMRASKIERLPLEDYIMIVDYIKEMPLDTEKDAVASALNGYVDVVSDDKKENLYKTILLLKPNNALYIRKYAEFLNSKGRYKEMAALVKRLIDKSDLNGADFISEVMPKVVEHLDDNTILKAINLFILAGNSARASDLYDLLHFRNPDNKEYTIGKLILQVENENVEEVIKFFRENEPDHRYADIVKPEIIKFEKKRATNPFDYHIHFVLGFLYYLTERYEEAIASFQFVLRSHRFESVMSLFLGMSFEKIGLSDFALKRYQSALNMDLESETVKIAVYEKAISIYLKQGKLEEAQMLGEKAKKIGLQDDALNSLIESLPKENKILHIEEMKNDK